MSPNQQSVLTESGELAAESPLPMDEVARLYEAMVSARVFDAKCVAMQVQGRLATYAPFRGQEAAQIGAAAVLQPRDWLVASYRDAAAMWFRGYPWREMILWRAGDERGGHPPDDVRVLPASITVGGHMIHAVGIGWAERLLGSDAVAMTMFGDGATSEGDFHEAMNLAGVYGTPTVFVCQNNGWAISMPRRLQTRSDTLAEKADGYGFPGVLVDGNDVLAVYAAATEAVERARRGAGPTLIEALTYRMGPHTTTDDPSRYRDEAELDPWRAKDPLVRVRLLLEAAGAWDDARQIRVEEAAAQLLEDAVAAAEAVEAVQSGEIFDGMFESPTLALEEQRAMAIEEGR